MYFKRNGTAIGGLHHSSGDEYDVQTLTLCAYFMRGDIFEIFMHNKFLSPSQIENATSYLKSKQPF